MVRVRSITSTSAGLGSGLTLEPMHYAVLCRVSQQVGHALLGLFVEDDNLVLLVPCLAGLNQHVDYAMVAGFQEQDIASTVARAWLPL